MKEEPNQEEKSVPMEFLLSSSMPSLEVLEITGAGYEQAPSCGDLSHFPNLKHLEINHSLSKIENVPKTLKNLIIVQDKDKG